jgi:hypothetical protein
MAINITDQPQEWTPAYNQMRFVVASTNTAQANFRYVADVYVSGVTDYVRLTFYANPDSGYGVIDIMQIIQSHISYDIDHTTYGFQRCTNSYKPYVVRFGEQYGTTPTVYPNLTDTGTKYAWNACLRPEQLQTFDYNNYTPNGNGAFLTARPERIKFQNSGESSYLHFINNVSGTAYFLKITTFNEAGGTIGTYTIENPYQASSSVTQDKVLRVAVGYEDLNNATLATGSQPVIDDSVYSYRVELTNFAGTNTSTSYYFDRDCTVRSQNAVQIMFLNELGGFDSYLFRFRRAISSSNQRGFVEKNNGYLTTGGAWNQDNINRGEKQVSSNITDTLSVVSDPINDTNVSFWLRELIESPEIYFHNYTYLLPMICADNNYDFKYKEWDQVWEFSATFRYANKRTRQR